MSYPDGLAGYLSASNSGTDVPFESVLELSALIAVGIDDDIEADDAFVMFDSDDDDERDYEDEDEQNDSFSWSISIIDYMSGVFDPADPLVSPVYNIIGTLSTAAIDYEEQEEEDDIEGTVAADSDLPYPMVEEMVLEVLTPTFFVLMRPSVNLFASALTMGCLVGLFQVCRTVFAPPMYISYIWFAVWFSYWTITIKCLVSIMQNYFNTAFTSDDE